MKVLVFGATGLLGQALMRAARGRGADVCGISRHGADVVLDVCDQDSVLAFISDFRPDVVFNAAALVDIGACEADPARAHAVNADAVGTLARACASVGAKLVQISTDAFFTGDGDARHDEDAPVKIVNEYARSKYVGEKLALGAPGALVVRTNIAGFRGEADRPSFAEWAVAAIRANAEVTLFDDFCLSTIEVNQLADALFDLIDRGAAGVLNVASSSVASKKTFIEALARAMGRSLDHAKTGSVRSLSPPRPDSLGLDVTRAEALLGRPLPDLDAVIAALVTEGRLETPAS